MIHNNHLGNFFLSGTFLKIVFWISDTTDFQTLRWQIKPIRLLNALCRPFLKFTSLAPLVAIFCHFWRIFYYTDSRRNRRSNDGWTFKLRRFVIPDWNLQFTILFRIFYYKPGLVAVLVIVLGRLMKIKKLPSSDVLVSAHSWSRKSSSSDVVPFCRGLVWSKNFKIRL